MSAEAGHAQLVCHSPPPRLAKLWTHDPHPMWDPLEDVMMQKHFWYPVLVLGDILLFSPAEKVLSMDTRLKQGTSQV